jgi:hypothetical protein
VKAQVIVRGIIEGVRAGLPFVVIASGISAWLKGRINPGWELRLTLVVIVVAMVVFGLGLLLRRWAWLDEAATAAKE